MSKLHLHVRVRFRAFGITFATYEQHLERVIPLSLAGLGYTLMHVNERGVEVSLTWEPVTA